MCVCILEESVACHCVPASGMCVRGYVFPAVALLCTYIWCGGCTSEWWVPHVSVSVGYEMGGLLLGSRSCVCSRVMWECVCICGKCCVLVGEGWGEDLSSPTGKCEQSILLTLPRS